MIRDHGQDKKYHHLIEGYNGRLDALQAAILRVKLPHLNNWNEKRREAAAIYNNLLKDVDGLQTPGEPGWSRGNYHLYVVRVQQRTELQTQLAERNIGTGLHYPIPLHLQAAYTNLGYRNGDLPVAEKVAHEILSLPMFPQLLKAQQEEIADALAGRTVPQ